MFIHRSPLGQGNLSFGKRKQRYPIILMIGYVLILAAALFLIFRAQDFQPQIAAMLGPSPTPTPSVEQLTQAANDAYLAGKMDEAAAFYQQASLLDPTNVQIWADLARMLMLAQHLDEAFAAADQAILVAPEDPRGYAIKGRILDWQGNYQDSVIASLRALELDSSYAPAHAYLAEAYADLGRLRQAREQAELAVQLDPYNVDARRNYAYVLEFYGDYEGAIQQYLQALKLNSNLLELWYGLAQNYRGAGQPEQAISTFNEIANRTPNDPRVYVELGKTYFEIRDDEAAQEVLEHAVELVCQNCPLYDSKAILDGGLPFIQSKRNLPETVYLPAWTRLGMVYFTRRNYESAIAIFEEAIAYGKEHGEDVSLEAYYVTAAAYYYLDRCEIAVPRAVESLNLYRDRNMDAKNALTNILSVFVLCRDYAGNPYVHTGDDYVNGFPPGYQEPDVLVQRPDLGTTATPTP
jgi:tetratricopeptide (TPR) repeat protein